MNKIFILLSLLLCSSSYAFELIMIQGVSKTKQTFIARMGKQDGIFEGKEATFTANDVSIIAKAISVTREFSQWEISNNYTDVPFRKGEVVTYYDTKEYLWALTPEKLKQKYIKEEIYHPRLSMAIHSSFLRGISGATSGADNASTQRGGMSFEGFLEKEYSQNLAFAGGLRYEEEVINVDVASLNAKRFIGIVETRYYFNKIQDFYNARFMLALGAGYGQASLETSGQSSAGNAFILPITKGAMVLPIDKFSDLLIEVAFENVRSDLEFEDGSTQGSNDNNFRFGLGYKKYFK